MGRAIGGALFSRPEVPDDHYLRQELYSLIQQDTGIFEFLQTGSLDGMWYWDLENPEHEWMSPAFWAVMGYDPAEKEHLASEWQDLIHPDDLETAMENFRRHCADSNHPYDQIVRYRHRDGHAIWVRCRGIAIRDASDNPVRMLGAHTDITPQKQAEQSLRELGQRFELAMDSAGIGVWEFDVLRHEMIWDDRMVALFGLGALDTTSPLEASKQGIHPEDLPRIKRGFRQALRGEKEFNTELRIVWPNEEIRWIRTSGRVTHSEQGVPIRMTGVSWDITRRKSDEAAIRRLAETDSLTGVSNRRYFLLRAEEELKRSNRYSIPTSLLLLDIDRFKSINDSHGHSVGDEVLRGLATTCTDALRETDLFGRLGGEEFAGLLIHTEAEEALQIAERLRQACEALCLPSQNGSIRCSVSIGLTSSNSRAARSVEDLLKLADTALYQAKAAGRNRVVVAP